MRAPWIRNLDKLGADRGLWLKIMIIIFWNFKIPEMKEIR